VVKAGFGSGVSESLKRWDTQAVDAADIDDACGGARGRSSFEKGRDGLCELEDAL